MLPWSTFLKARTTTSIKRSSETAGQTNINYCRVSELNKQNINKYMISKQILSKFVAKLLKYRIMFKDILPFLGLNNRDASLIIM